MTEIEEISQKLVSFEVAYLAKQKGFDLPTIYYHLYRINNPEEHTSIPNRIINFEKRNWNSKENPRTRVSVPTVDELEDWFKLKHNISIRVLDVFNNGNYTLFTNKDNLMLKNKSYLSKLECYNEIFLEALEKLKNDSN